MFIDTLRADKTGKLFRIQTLDLRRQESTRLILVRMLPKYDRKASFKMFMPGKVVPILRISVLMSGGFQSVT